MRKLILVIPMFLVGCASMDIHLASSEVRQKNYKLETKLKKDVAFEKIQTWAAKAGGEIRLSDRASGTVVLRANVDCDALKMGNGYGRNQALWFILELKADESVIHANFTDLKSQAIGSWDTGMRPSSQAEVETVVTECIEPLKNSIQRVI